MVPNVWRSAAIALPSTRPVDLGSAQGRSIFVLTASGPISKIEADENLETRSFGSSVRKGQLLIVIGVFA